MSLPVFNRQILVDVRALLAFVAILVGGWLIIELRTLALAFFLSLILMTALNPAVNRFSRVLPRGLSIVLVSLLVILIVIALLAVLVPPLVIETANLFNWIGTSDFLKSTPFVQMLNGENLPTSIESIPLTLNELSQLFSTLQTPFASIVSFAASAFGGIILFISLFVMTFYLLVDRPELAKKAGWFTKNKHDVQRIEQFIAYWEKEVGGWIRGELLLMLVIGILTYITLALFRVPYALPLAILSGLLEIVPNVGPTVAAIPTVIIAYVALGPVTGSFILIATIVIQQLENNLIVPKVMKATANVNPLVVLLGILAGAELLGVLGALLAVPLYLTLRAWYSFYILERPTEKN